MVQGTWSFIVTVLEGANETVVVEGNWCFVKVLEEVIDETVVVVVRMKRVRVMRRKHIGIAIV